MWASLQKEEAFIEYDVKSDNGKYSTVLIHIKTNLQKAGPHVSLQHTQMIGQAALIMYSVNEKTLWKGRSWLRGEQHDLELLGQRLHWLSSL